MVLILYVSNSVICLSILPSYLTSEFSLTTIYPQLTSIHPATVSIFDSTQLTDLWSMPEIMTAAGPLQSCDKIFRSLAACIHLQLQGYCISHPSPICDLLAPFCPSWPSPSSSCSCYSWGMPELAVWGWLCLWKIKA